MNLIETASDFKMAFEFLDQEQRTIFLSKMQTRLPRLINTCTDFNTVLKPLNGAQCALVCEVMQESQPDFAQSILGIILILQDLNQAQCMVVCQLMQGCFLNLIKTLEHLILVLKDLNNSGQCAVICRMMHINLLNIIRTAEDFRVMVDLLPKPRYAVVFQALAEISMTHQSRAMYQRLWDSPLAPNPGKTVDIALCRAAQLLNEYTKNNSRMKRIVFFHWNRASIAPVVRLIGQIKNGDIANSEVLKDKLYDMLRLEDIHPTGSLLKRIGFIVSHLPPSPTLEYAYEEAFRDRLRREQYA